MGLLSMPLSGDAFRTSTDRTPVRACAAWRIRGSRRDSHPPSPMRAGRASASSTREPLCASSSPLPRPRLGIGAIELAHKLPHERQLDRLVACTATTLCDAAPRLVARPAAKADQIDAGFDIGADFLTPDRPGNPELDSLGVRATRELARVLDAEEIVVAPARVLFERVDQHPLPVRAGCQVDPCPRDVHRALADRIDPNLRKKHADERVPPIRPRKWKHE